MNSGPASGHVIGLCQLLVCHKIECLEISVLALVERDNLDGIPGCGQYKIAGPW